MFNILYIAATCFLVLRFYVATKETSEVLTRFILRLLKDEMKVINAEIKIFGKVITLPWKATENWRDYLSDAGYVWLKETRDVWEPYWEYLKEVDYWDLINQVRIFVFRLILMRQSMLLGCREILRLGRIVL